MADEVISAAAVQSLPAGYQVPAAQTIGVKSVRAIIDGSGAGAAFLATLQLISPAGQVVWQSAQDTAIAAGGSADASWFPGVSAAASSTPPPPAGALAYANVDFHTKAIVAPATTTFLDSFPVVTNDSSVFTTGSKLEGGTLFHGPVLNAAGTYLVWAGCLYTGTVVGDVLRFDIGDFDSGFDGFYINRDIQLADAPGGTNQGSVSWMQALHVGTGDPGPPSSPQIYDVRNDTAGRGSATASAFYVYLGPGEIF